MRTVLAVNPNTHENKEDQNTPTTPSLALSFSSQPPCPGYFLPQCLQSIFLALCFSIWPLSGCRTFVDLSVCECIQLHPQWGDLDLYSFVEYPRVMSLAPFTVILNHNIFFVSQLYVMRILEKVEQSPGVFKLYWRHRTEAVIKVFYVFNRKRTLVHNNGDWFTFVWWQINNIP